ncbi:probable N-acetylglucosaminyl-phosphatidylinositol de-N-acetylase isoform X3 [Phoenix dactylifera]|uniref:N-acetylglucosaminylphosphatidylinositol deacetylase n=1 Tax=Phoenix dactylifera TaxID=42345 RepID=A0A8B8J0E7_PHODC|nr:probable N-acetylglucosaminyl-phosphatidylinositol de-N-acetylase isoform X3 [Phoenix dactylifera]
MPECFPPPLAIPFEMAWILAAVTVISLWAISLWRVLCGFSCFPSKPAFLPSSGSGKKRNVLLVVAHPDDESMFFAPTILFLTSEGHNLHILCMSTGNAEGVGNVRKEELYRACVVLKIPLQHVKILDHPELQDGFNNRWDHKLLSTIIEDEIKMWDIDSISTSILRKYSGPVDIWFSILCSLSSGRQMYCIPNSLPRKSYLAMAEHESQWVWFRKLFVLFSSYTYTNTLRKINF